jgi:ketosteroid isomerase-like protein
MAESNTELARRGYEAASRGDLDTVRELLHPSVKWHGGDPSALSACHNRVEAAEFMRQAPGRRGVGELVEVVGAGDEVVVILRPLGGEGEESALSANLTTFRDGKAIEMVHY